MPREARRNRLCAQGKHLTSACHANRSKIKSFDLEETGMPKLQKAKSLSLVENCFQGYFAAIRCKLLPEIRCGESIRLSFVKIDV